MTFVIAHQGRAAAAPSFAPPLVYLRDYDPVKRFARFTTAPSLAMKYETREAAESVVVLLVKDQRRGLRDTTVTHCVIAFIDSSSTDETDATAEMRREQMGVDGPSQHCAADY